MIRFKNVLKGFGGAIVIFCAAFIVYLFQGFRLDLLKLDVGQFSTAQKALYDAQITQSNLMLAISTGILGVFAVITLFFSISKYIKDNQQNMGILKAMGYERKQIAIEFTKFSFNAFLGSLLAIAAGVIFQPLFYREMTKDAILPAITPSFHPLFVLILLIVPGVIFGIAAYFIAYRKLAKRPLEMIRGGKSKRTKKLKEKKTFLKTLKHAMLKNHISLIVFVGFASLCFGATVQMSFSLNQLHVSSFFFWMMFGIGLLLGSSILYLAFSFAYTENREYVSLMKAYGYHDREALQTMYGGYALVTVLGFLIGTVYQYGLICLMIDLFSETMLIAFTFHPSGLVYTLLIFIPMYLLINLHFYFKLKKLPIKDALLAE